MEIAVEKTFIGGFRERRKHRTPGGIHEVLKMRAFNIKPNSTNHEIRIYCLFRRLFTSVVKSLASLNSL